jgi:glycosyltransferase involved in cell wall biosynthesis
MRVAVFTNQFPGRLNTFFARDMRALLECGIELDIFAFYPPNERLWDNVPELLDATVLPRNRVHLATPGAVLRGARPWPGRRTMPVLRDSAPILAAAARYGPNAIAKSAYASAYASATIRRFGSQPFDHVLAYWGNHAASVAYLFHRNTHPNIPFSMFVHARMDLYHQPAFLAEKMLYADNIFLVCEYNRTYLEQHFPDVYGRIAPRVAVHHLGLPLEQMPFHSADRAGNRIVSVGNLEPLKGHAGLLRAVAALRRRGIDLCLDLVGGGPQDAALWKLAAQLELGDHVQFHGWPTPDEVLELMRRATALVHPSVAPDAMPTVVKEALAVGTPVIASDLAGIPEMLDGGRCGVLVPPGEIPALEQAIAALLADPVRRQALAAAGRAHMEAGFDMWRNGRALAERLRATVRVKRESRAIAS